MRDAQKEHFFEEFDKYGRYIEDSCYGCFLDDCSHCPRVRE